MLVYDEYQVGMLVYDGYQVTLVYHVTSACWWAWSSAASSQSITILIHLLECAGNKVLASSSAALRQSIKGALRQSISKEHSSWHREESFQLAHKATHK